MRLNGASFQVSFLLSIISVHVFIFHFNRGFTVMQYNVPPWIRFDSGQALGSGACPPILRELAADNAKAAPKKAAANNKNNKLEVC